MSFLTRVPIEKLARGTGAVRSGRTNPHLTPDGRHRLVMSLFGDLEGEGQDGPRSANGILFRFDRSAVTSPCYLIRSAQAPTELEAFGLDPAECVREEPDATTLPPGTPVRFRLTVNAVRRPREVTAGGTRGRSMAVRPVPFDDTADEDMATGDIRMTPWLQGKLDGALGDVEILDHQREVLGGRTSGKSVQIDTVDGAGTITDPVALAQLMGEGVGRAKSYGCGLLTIRPVL